ncbi:PQQ-dependent dehydrogenase, methanol/ethanol family [uncultured Zhongshania sp.]|jgi:PQQ-dependent dehydrogenase (methanol/ethanol family)|uniref:PQQ-dependent dehydrogenase, methanol/ethanol family n=1 Tax=uncultured Zhongshania sp. TaxID=1642288 RepID=UPI0030DBF350|tara:strand:- start:33073 stop:35202 length:2130 start_codon:yes stop_codon:yes gene_type:complete
MITYANIFKLVIIASLLVACTSKSTDSNIEKDNASARLVNAASEPQNWLTHGRTYDEQRHSPLDQINTANVSDLGLTWSFDMTTKRGVEATPIVVDGVMYVTGSWSIVYALDAKTGKLLWDYDPKVDRATAVKACCDVVNRGVAYYGGKIYLGTIDGRLVALDGASGETVWDVMTVDPTKSYTITGAPRVIKGKVVIGNGGAEMGVRGYVSAYDAITGEMHWRFYTVPGNPVDGFENDAMKMAAATWNGEWWKWGGGGTVWDSMAYDPEFDLLYIGVGNGSPWNHKLRSNGEGDNLFLASIVAIRPDTGEYVWHYQTTPGESWDYTATQHIMLADLTIEGKLRKVLMQAPKNGFFYVIDRKTGELISANNYVDINWASHVDMKTGRPVELPGVRDFSEPKVITPGSGGGHNWHPMSYEPETGLVYIPAQNFLASYLDPQDPSDKQYKPGTSNLGVDMMGLAAPDQPGIRPAMRKMFNSFILAWDPITQKSVWQFDHKDVGASGMVTTAGGLLFQANPQGYLTAYNSRTGEKLWSQWLQTNAMAAPISYQIDGEQYIAIAAGWGGGYATILGGLTGQYGLKNRSRVLVYKLGGTSKLPAVEKSNAAIPPPAEAVTADETVLNQGMLLYHRNCQLCHGDRAVSGGVIPDLRRSSKAVHDMWPGIVIGGALQDGGMVGFSNILDMKDAEAIRQYILQEAAKAYAAQNTPETN